MVKDKNIIVIVISPSEKVDRTFWVLFAIWLPLLHIIGFLLLLCDLISHYCGQGGASMRCYQLVFAIAIVFDVDVDG